jgi:hypothetical protein
MISIVSETATSTTDGGDFEISAGDGTSGTGGDISLLIGVASGVSPATRPSLHVEGGVQGGGVSCDVQSFNLGNGMDYWIEGDSSDPDGCNQGLFYLGFPTVVSAPYYADAGIQAMFMGTLTLSVRSAYSTSYAEWCSTAGGRICGVQQIAPDESFVAVYDRADSVSVGVFPHLKFFQSCAVVHCQIHDDWITNDGDAEALQCTGGIRQQISNNAVYLVFEITNTHRNGGNAPSTVTPSSFFKINYFIQTNSRTACLAEPAFSPGV